MIVSNKEKVKDSFITYMKEAPASSWVEIDKKAFEHNISNYKAVIKPASLACVIKSNAYGHGIEQIAKICDQNNSVDMLFVVSLHEALFLRSIGISKPLFVLSIVADGNLQDAITQNIGLVMYDVNTILELNNLGKIVNKKAIIHLKVDTGLSRLGLNNDEILKTINSICKLPFVSVQGIFTHFAESESTDQTFTNYQIERFDNLINQLESMGVSIPLKHAACSAAATANTASHHTLVRVGIGLYGLWPSHENKQMTQQSYPQFSLKPVLTWKTKIIQIKDLPAGSYIGYDRTHKTDKQARIAILPVGYWDGLDRRLSNKGKVLINNQLASIVGRISMNLCAVDITGLKVCLEDEVTLLGDHAGITADKMAQCCQTINYEIVTRINPLLARRVKE